MSEKAVVDEMITSWRIRVMWITLKEAIILLRHLGEFDQDRIIIRERGYARFPVHALLHLFDVNEYCVNIRPVYFEGGPTGGKRFKGTLLTMILDRMLLTAHEKGAEYVLNLVKYARGFGTTNDFKRDFASNLTYSI